ncbi:hypothetical protein GLOTRDRAFT_74064 [Gloeophyllum trabeum ATCC 11539]|uniref:Calcineurin-like phosphoesterase domain-containing protein n=1 Tax=Gloeophyllum trabeum (strain ATCC 11539 / FP-39264 / Madison 617) TaxID=670483 RepID=S7QD69_GLOTA|nr:uncharacterized protein GLOTRDRAFT_74064 [Gloeophyllum trabeum ATCC 11539]EPQ57338.1 hypothetical protein GLOTRDRAFT_74064 [Gloeophyllum trabeum ATCC 11539]
MSGLRERRSGRLSRACAPHVLLNGLRIFWFSLILWAEIGIYFYRVGTCSWPDKSLRSVPSERPAHVLLIADPQVRNPALPHASKWTWSGWRQSILDFSVKKSWNVLSRSNVDVVIFLGDMLASGRIVSSENEYKEYVGKFREVFPLDRLTRRQDSTVPVYFIPGNEDIGLGKSIYYSKNARRYYVKYFGPLNQKVYVRNHTFALLNAPGLVDEDYQRAARDTKYEQWVPIPGGPVNFIETVRQDTHDYPVVLFSHIPLGRPETASCGPLREKGTIVRGVGPSYQNMLGKYTTSYVLETLRPQMVFSGDDRDYCDYTHVLPPAEHNPTGNTTFVREVTVKSFSLAKNIRHPGYHLLSVTYPSFPSASQKTLADRPCQLPNPLALYSSVYTPLIFLSFIIIAASQVYFHRTKRGLRLHHTSSPRLSISPVPFTDTDGSSLYALSQYTPAPESAIWSPSTPGMKQPSPRGVLPSVRTPLSAPMALSARSLSAPVLRATQSRPGSPLLSPAHSQLMLPHADEEDMMNNLSMEHAHTNGHGSLTPYEHSNYDEESDTEEAAYFLPTTDSKSTRHRSAGQRTWSWSFELLGRRRRMTLRVPTAPSALSTLGYVLSGEFLGNVGRRKSLAARTRSEGIMWAVLLDAAVVAWSAAGFWIALNWWLRWII